MLPSSNVCFQKRAEMLLDVTYSVLQILTWVFSLLYRGRAFLEEIELQVIAVPEFTRSSGYSNVYKDIFIRVNYLWKSEG